VEEMFIKTACTAGEQSIPGWHTSNNTTPRPTKRHLLRKGTPKTEKSKSQRRCVVCSQLRKKISSVHCCQIC